MDRLRGGRTEWIQLSGWSMAPALRDGDWLKIAPGTPSVGETVVFARGGELVAHRLIAVRDGLAITRGDDAAGDDAPIAVSELLGRVVEVKRSWWHRLRSALRS
jgi:signal peptidase